MTASNLPRALSGDRPTGPLHLGHLVGSLENRLCLQKTHNLTVLIADTQAQADCGHRPLDLSANVLRVMEDYLRVGLNPFQTRFVLQSQVPSLFALHALLLNFATVSHMSKNPTVKKEGAQKGFKNSPPLSFFTYPVSQTSDIIGLGGGVVPVGEDQLPMLELTRDIIGKINTLGLDVSLPSALLSHTPRLSGIYGVQKMSKSLNNAIFLCETPTSLLQKTMQIYTDPNHLKVSDKGSIKGNIVFEYLDVFDPDKERVAEFKKHYRKGGLGDVTLKKHLYQLLKERFDQFQSPQKNPTKLRDILQEHSATAEKEAFAVFCELRAKMFPLLG